MNLVYDKRLINVTEKDARIYMKMFVTLDLGVSAIQTSLSVGVTCGRHTRHIISSHKCDDRHLKR